MGRRLGVVGELGLQPYCCAHACALSMASLGGEFGVVAALQ